MEYAYNFKVEDVLMHFGVNESQGLSSKEVFLARQKYGKNGLIIILKTITKIFL